MIGEIAMDNYLADLDYQAYCGERYEYQYESGLQQLEAMRKEFEEATKRRASRLIIRDAVCRHNAVIRLKNKYRTVRSNKV